MSVGSSKKKQGSRVGWTKADFARYYRRWYLKNKKRQNAYIRAWQLNNPRAFAETQRRSKLRAVRGLSDWYLSNMLKVHYRIAKPTKAQIERLRKRITLKRARRFIKLSITAQALCKTSRH